jgi:hypothetical protein
LEVLDDSEKDPKATHLCPDYTSVERSVPDIKATIDCHKHVFKRIHDDIKNMTIKNQGTKRPFLISDKKLVAMVNIIKDLHKD